MKIKMSLTKDPIDKAIEQIAKYQETLDIKCERISRELAERGVEIAKLNIVEYDAIFTEELLDSIHIGKGKDNATFYVIADSIHAAFVEFGTGYVGKDNPYKYNLPEGVTWNYLVGEKLIANAKKGIYGWVYRAADGGYYFTEGMESRPFMNDTLTDLENIVVQVVKEVF